MNVLVLGWYHHRNAGDDRMQQVLTEWLDGHTLGFLPAGRPLPASFARRWDVVVIGGGSVLVQRGGVLRDLARWIGRARVPVALLGVGADDPAADLVDELGRAASRWSVGWFRDHGSLEVLGLEAGGATFVGPDLTWLRPHPPDERPLRARSGTAVAVAAHGGLSASRWSPALAALPDPRPWPMLLEGDADRRLLHELLPEASVPTGYDLEVAAASELVVSARYHGLVFALQLGRPVVGIGDAPKVARLLDDAGLGDWWVPAADPDRLAPLVASIRADLPAADERVRAVGDRLRSAAERCGHDAWARIGADARPLAGRSAWRRLLP